MSLSVSCPNCGKRFKNIKPELAGKKARCACGNVVRLGGAKIKDSDSDSSPLHDDLMQVDLLGDELLGDDLLGDAMLGQSSSAPAEAAASSRPPATSEPRISESRNRSSKKRRRSKSKTTTNKPGSSQPPAKSPQPKPAEAEEPIFGQSYSDLDAILEGAGDAAPIVARPPQESRDAQTPDAETVLKKRRGSPVGLVSALLSGTIAFWFGVFALVSKFKIIDQLLTSGFSNALHNVYTGDFGLTEASEVNERYQAIFSALGWAFWLVALCLMIFGATQFLNSLYRLFTKRHFIRPIDGLTATCGVVALFLMVGWIFAQASKERAQHKFLNEYERPATVVGEELEVVTLLREEIETQHTLTRNWLLAGALVPMSVFVLSMTRLLTLRPNRSRRL